MSERSRIYQHEIDLGVENCPPPILIGYVRKPLAKILDVGCACGDMGVAIHRAMGEDVSVYGMEINAGSIKVAEECGAYACIWQCDLDRFEADDFPACIGAFDYIICGDVLEHLRNPVRTLCELKRFLVDGGEILASIPNVAHMSVKANLLVDDFTYTPIGLLDQTHVHFFTYKSIAEELASAGLEILESKVTMVERNGWQPNDPYRFLNVYVQRFVFENPHSYVCQYVIRAVSTEDAKHEVVERNLARLQLRQEELPTYVREYHRKLLESLPASEEEKLLADRDRLARECGLLLRQRDSSQAAWQSVVNSRRWRFVNGILAFLGFGRL